MLSTPPLTRAQMQDQPRMAQLSLPWEGTRCQKPSRFRCIR